MNNHPPIKNGTRVRTTSDLSHGNKVAGYLEEAKLFRKVNTDGIVIGHHDSHGLCYDIRHDDGTEGTYEPYELSILE